MVNSNFKVIEQIVQEIFNHDEIVIAGHIHPDGDAISSCLALAMSISALGKEVKVLLEDYHKKYNFIAGGDLIYKGDYSLLSTNFFISLDCGSKERLGEAETVFDRAKKTVVIDHHISEHLFGDINYVVTNASSTCEMVYDVVALIGNMNKKIASAIYAGIIFDTGGFRFGSTSADTMGKIAKLMEYGIPFTQIYTETMFTHTFVEAMLFSDVIGRMTFLEDKNLVYSNLSIMQMTAKNGNTNDLDGIVEYLLNTDGAEIAVFVYETKPGISKVSFRSKEVNVNEFALNWGGGGHKNAAGCTIVGDVDSVLNMVVDYVTKR